MMTKPINPLLLGISIAGLALLTVVLVIYLDPGATVVEEPTVSSAKPDGADALAENTIASAWQWAAEPGAGKDSAPVEAQQPEGEPMPFTPDSVYAALQAVKLDENGDVIADHDALLALEATLAATDARLAPAQIAALQALIKQGLPGKAGEQTARIVGDYAELLKAEADFNDVYFTEDEGAQNLTADDFERQYQELQALREVYMGNEVASSLFAVTDANAQYMFESQRIESDTSLSTQEKLAMASELQAQHVEQTTGIRDWNQRYKTFMAEKQRVVNAGLSDNEKRTQIAALMRQHFDNHELEKVSHLPLGDVTDIN
ncbi:lipase secretion chaperone [Allohahella sp. A8]|uniref:lipase secretion chaperone n=1 Tax=Allohahella sp. A8 TaxID=3141461 RepID=UPI003A7F6A8D